MHPNPAVDYRGILFEQFRGIALWEFLKELFMTDDVVPSAHVNQSMVKAESRVPLYIRPHQDFKHNTQTAILPEYIEKVKKRVAGLPTAVFKGDGHRVIAGNDDYTNPFNVYQTLNFSFGDWEQENNMPFQRSELSERTGRGDNFVALRYCYNLFHLGFLIAMNLSDPEERSAALQRLGDKVFHQSSNPTISQISPYDKPDAWTALNALTVLLSPEAAITPVARYRAIQSLSSLDLQHLTETMFQPNIRERSCGRDAQILGFAEKFTEESLRLPRRFWDTTEEKIHTNHPRWRENRHIQDIFGDDPDYGRSFNMLVEKYPKEAVHVALLFISEMKDDGWFSDKKRYRSSAEAGFHALLAMSRSDPLTIGELFGNGASYLRLSSMTQSTSDQIQEGLGIHVYDHDFAAGLDGLPKAEILKVVRRQAQSIETLEGQLYESSSRMAAEFFRHSSKKDIKHIDPEGYYKTLGVHPETDPDVIQIVINTAYRKLAQQYHPDLNGPQANVSKMKAINTAFEVLGDPDKRKGYGA